MLILLFFLFLLALLPFLFAWFLKMEEEEEQAMIPHKEELLSPSLLDLPELTLDCILQKLSPAGLCSLSAVCRSLREHCKSDRLWGKHMDQKWGRVVGDAARVEWDHRVVESRRTPTCLPRGKGTSRPVLRFGLFSWVRKESVDETKEGRDNSLPRDSIMAMYLSLESGNFWFPAQVYNRENGHSGFVLSCYDAHISYDSSTNTFQARYPSQGGRRMIEDNIPWTRIREPPTSTPPYELHSSDRLNDLKPGDHFEIQWRKSEEFPFGWWYGIVGHLESCSGREDCCHCAYSDAVTLEFNHHPLNSRWRKKVISRNKHPEEGVQVTGSYGGIRKLWREEEIAKWKSLWPSGVPA